MMRFRMLLGVQPAFGFDLPALLVLGSALRRNLRRRPSWWIVHNLFSYRMMGVSAAEIACFGTLMVKPSVRALASFASLSAWRAARPIMSSAMMPAPASATAATL